MSQQETGQRGHPSGGMDEEFAAGLRGELVKQVSQTKRVPARHRRLAIGAGLGLGVAVVGGGAVAVATGLIPALLGGGTEVTPLTEAKSDYFVGSGGLDLGEPPEGATGVSVTFNCLSRGEFVFDDGAKAICYNSDVGSSATGHVLDLSAIDDNRVTMTTSPEAQWTMTAYYVHERLTDWHVNEHGQTYGVMNERGTPDLVAVIATNGREGYVLGTELDGATGVTAARDFTSPEDALAWQEERKGKVFILPVYESDGVTEIGEFVIG